MTHLISNDRKKRPTGCRSCFISKLWIRWMMDCCSCFLTRTLCLFSVWGFSKLSNIEIEMTQKQNTIKKVRILEFAKRDLTWDSREHPARFSENKRCTNHSNAFGWSSALPCSSRQSNEGAAPKDDETAEENLQKRCSCDKKTKRDIGGENTGAPGLVF